MKSLRIQLCLGIVLLLSFLILPSFEAIAFQNEPDGFRGIKWGTNIKNLRDMQLYGDFGDEKFYTRKNDKLKIGEAKLEKITYIFNKGRLGGVMICFTSASNASIIKETLTQHYGENFFTPPAEILAWNGRNVFISFSYIEMEGIDCNGSVHYTYKPLKKEEEKKKMEKMRKGASDL